MRDEVKKERSCFYFIPHPSALIPAFHPSSFIPFFYAAAAAVSVVNFIWSPSDET